MERNQRPGSEVRSQETPPDSKAGPQNKKSLRPNKKVEVASSYKTDGTLKRRPDGAQGLRPALEASAAVSAASGSCTVALVTTSSVDAVLERVEEQGRKEGPGGRKGGLG